jgi:hypothetical protein
MNLVQLAEHAKNLSNQQLQQMLQAPTGEMPPFLLAAEAARRQDVERSAQVGPADNTTVLDELIQGRAQATGLNALTNQAAAPAPPQPPAMAGGGITRYSGGYTTPGYVPPHQSFDIGGALDFGWRYLTDPNIFRGPQTPTTPPSTSSPIPSAGGIADIKMDTREHDGFKTYGSEGDRYVEREAARKEAETKKKNEEMGNPETVTDEGGGETDEFRDRLDAIYNEDDDVQRLFGMSSSGLAGIGAALLSNERGLSEGERWANAAGALAGDTESRDLKRQKVSQEEAMAMLKYDMAKKASDDATSSADIGNMAEGYKNSATYFLDIGKAYASQANDLRKSYQQTDAFGMPGAMAPIPPEVQTKIDQLEQASRDALLRAQYNQAQYGGIYGVEPYDAVWDGGELRTR